MIKNKQLHSSETEMFMKRYLSLLGCSELEAANPSLNGLKTIMEQHIHSVYFSIFSVFSMDSNMIELDPYQCLDKKLTQRQGGICFELNIALNHLLKTLGYQAFLVDALMDHVKDQELPQYDFATHNTMVVSLEDKYYLVDVGLGNFFRHPIPFLEEHQDPTGRYRVINIGDDANQSFCLERFSKRQERWISQYRFSLREKEPLEFLPNAKGVCEANFHLTNEFFLIKPYAIDSYKLVDGGRDVPLTWIHKTPDKNEKISLTPDLTRKILTEEFHMKAHEIDKVLSECKFVKTEGVSFLNKFYQFFRKRLQPSYSR